MDKIEDRIYELEKEIINIKKELKAELKELYNYVAEKLASKR